jgi:hypothetical protein
MDVYELISRRRRQVLVHSIIYYRFNKNIISDAKWSEWATELCELQDQYPDVAQLAPYADDFKDFDPSTGYDLPLHDEWAINKALYLMKIYNL